MQFLLMTYLDEKVMASQTPAQRTARFEAYRVYTKSLIDAGVMQGGNALRPTTDASSVRVREGKTTMTDGPFAETKEQLGGYYLINCADMAEARRHAARCPAAFDGTVEVRPILDY